MRHTLRVLLWSAWLGWQVSTNWASPWLFALYVLAKPLAGALLLVFMFRAADLALEGGIRPGLLVFAYVGNAAYMLVGAVGLGMSGAVVADREQYGMLKYLRVSPAGLRNLTHVSRLLDDRLKRPANRHAAYVGEAAFAHKGGLHVSAVEKDPKSIHEVVRAKLAPSLEARPAKRPTDAAMLDRYEALIEHTRLAGRTQEAFDLYWWGLVGRQPSFDG